MAQATYVPDIAHEKAEAFAFFNAVFQAIATNNAGATAPTETFPGMWWWDTSTTPPTLRQRNAANSAWFAFQPPLLTQAQVEDSASTDAGLVSGQRLAQAVAALAPGAPYDYQEFTTSGTWTKPASADANDRVKVLVIGGGGGGGRNNDVGSNAAGGRGGSLVFYEFVASELGATVEVVVGAGGAGRSGDGTGSSGGASRFGADGANEAIQCNGGTGGGRGSSVSTTPQPGGIGALVRDGLSTTFPQMPFATGQGGGLSGGETTARPGLSSGIRGHGGQSGSIGGAGFFPGGGGGAGASVSGPGADGVVRVWCIRALA